MPGLYRLAADFVVLLHAAYVLFVVLMLPAIFIGGWRGWRWVRRPTLRYLHLTMILVVVIEAWLGITCPLTIWEQWLRESSGGSAYRGDFIPNLVHDWLFVDAAPWVFTVVYTLFGTAVAAGLVCVPPQRDRRASLTPSLGAMN